MAEIWDAYDSQFNKVEDIRLIRGESIPEGLYHLVCEVIVKHADGTYLLMQRDWEKPRGGLWELSAGGSALAGETPEACVARELKEETGIEAVDLRELRKIVRAERHSIYVEYLCVTAWDKTAVTLQKGETVGYQWVRKDELLGMREDMLASPRTYKLMKELGV